MAVGDPLNPPKIENPSREDVKEWHDKYMVALQKVFEDHKFEAYDGDAKEIKLEN